MQKKGQHEVIVPGVILLFLVFFLAYIFWTESSERARILGLRDTDTTSEVEQKLLLSQEVGYVGKGLAGVIKTHELGDLIVSYPKILSSKVSESKRYLQTWIFGKGIVEYHYEKSENISSLSITFNMEDVKGVPSVNIVLNGETISAATAAKDAATAIEVSSEQLKDANTIKIECVFNSWNIFETQSCLLSDINITEINFEKGDEVYIKDVAITQDETNSGTAKISFTVENENTAGDLIIKVNDIIMFKGKPSESINIKEKGWDSLGLQVGANTITFEADRGGYYDISNVKFESVMSKEEASSVGPYSFYVNSDVYTKSTLFKVEFYAEEITPGDLSFTLSGSDVIPYEYCPSNMDGCSHINNNAWNTITISKGNVITGTNTISIASEAGRYKISSLKVIWE